MREAVLGVIIAFTYSFLIVSTTSAPVECDFGNLQNVIGHKNFSLLGATAYCKLFYLDGELLDFTNSFANITENFLQRNTRATCWDERPKFYTNNNRLEVLVTWYNHLKLTNGNWTEAKPGFYTMPFESVTEGKSITPWVDNWYYVPRAGFVVDAFSDLGHFIAMDEGGFVDVPIRISNGEILQGDALRNKEEMGEPIGLDSDLKRLYFERKHRPDLFRYDGIEVHPDLYRFFKRKHRSDLFEYFVEEHLSGCSDIGYFDVSTSEDNILTLGTFVSMNWRRCDTFHMSFSNNFVIAVEGTPNSWRYYISKGGDKPECFLEEQTLYPIIIQLYVGSLNGKSLHDKIREQFRPSESIQMQNSERTTIIDVLVDPEVTETRTANPVQSSTSAEKTTETSTVHPEMIETNTANPVNSTSAEETTETSTVHPEMIETNTANPVRNSTSAEETTETSTVHPEMIETSTASPVSVEETPSEPSKHADSETSDSDAPSSLWPAVEQPPEPTTTGVPSANGKRLAEMVTKVVGPPSASGPGLIAIHPLLVSMLAGYFFI